MMGAGPEAVGKQVLVDGQHFADAATPEAAEAIVAALRSPNYETAWREFHDKLKWMNGHPDLRRYLGRNFADIANALIDEGHPGLRERARR